MSFDRINKLKFEFVGFFRLVFARVVSWIKSDRRSAWVEFVTLTLGSAGSSFGLAASAARLSPRARASGA
jgi:hypothetical protein